MKTMLVALPLLLTFACSKAEDFSAGVSTKKLAAPAAADANATPAAPVALPPVVEAAPEPLVVAPAPEKVITSNLVTSNVEVIEAASDGVAVSKLGINFEDWVIGDDYNDAVLCFEGRFDIVKGATTTIRSLRDQKVTFKRYNGSNTDHYINVKITHADGVIAEEAIAAYDSIRPRNLLEMEYTFKKGDMLDVSMFRENGKKTGATYSMNSEWAKILLDVCNDKGG